MTSEEILQQFMLQSQQQNKWNSPQNLINMATLGLGGISGLAAGAQQGRSDQMSLEQQARQRAIEDYIRRQQGRTGLQNAISGQIDRRDQAGVNVANASPLGWDQGYRQKMAGARAMSAGAENFAPLKPGPSSTVGGFVASSPNILGGFSSPDYRSTISNGATESAITDRRMTIDGLRADRPDQLARENQLMQLLNDQMLEASKPLYQEPTGQSAAPEKKKGFWSKLGSIALPIAGMAANFIPGVGPIAGAILSGIGSGAGAAIGGAGAGGILGAGAAGGAGAYGMSKAGIGEPGGFLGGRPAAPPSGFEGPNMTDRLFTGGQFAPDLVAPPSYGTPNSAMSGAPVSPSMRPAGAPVSRPMVPPTAPRPNGPAFGGGQPGTPGRASGQWSGPPTPASAPRPGGGFNPMSILQGGSAGPFAGAKVGGGPLQGAPGIMHPKAGGSSDNSPIMVHPSGRTERVPLAKMFEYLQQGWRVAGNPGNPNPTQFGGGAF